MRLFVFGYPGDLGGACTELWHTVKLWRQFDLPVSLIPTWQCDGGWRERVEDLGCETVQASPGDLDRIEELPGSIVVSFCNAAFLECAKELRELGCHLVWVNCMTWLFDAERRFNRQCGPFDAYMFQSEFQRAALEPELKELGYTPEKGHLIRGAFDFGEWEFRPRPHGPNDAFVVGRCARPDNDKWSSNTWPICERIQYANKRALMLGMDDRTHEKLGTPPPWADCLKPMAIPTHQFFANLHCLLPVNGGARENWPRAGLEAMAAGVPIVAQKEWGWREMIEHGVTGFLGSCDEELAHFAAMLAYDEDLRIHIARNARHRLETELAEPNRIWEGWSRLFQSLDQSATKHPALEAVV
jgi:hypothetical protein